MQAMPQLKKLVNSIRVWGWSFDTLTKISVGFENLTNQQKETRAYQINTILTDVKSEQTALLLLMHKGIL